MCSVHSPSISITLIDSPITVIYFSTSSAVIWRTQLNKDGCLWKKKIVLPNKNCKINIKKQPFATVLTGSITGILW